MGYEYDPNEYIATEARLRRMVEELEDIRGEVTARLSVIDPTKQEEWVGFYQASAKVIQAMFRAKWASEILDALEKKEQDTEDPVSVNQHGHSVREDDVPWLFWFLEVQRRGFVKALVADPRTANTLSYAGLINIEALTAMTIFVDDFVAIAPSLKTIDLGKDDPMRNVL